MIPEADCIAFPFTFLMLIDQFQYEWKVTHKETQGHVSCKEKIPYVIFPTSVGRV